MRYKCEGNAERLGNAKEVLYPCIYIGYLWLEQSLADTVHEGVCLLALGSLYDGRQYRYESGPTCITARND